tara:strand:- start:120 stop:245 length:126 start_codon:yes stop_codon:yes gene_type:complete
MPIKERGGPGSPGIILPNKPKNNKSKAMIKITVTICLIISA